MKTKLIISMSLGLFFIVGLNAQNAPSEKNINSLLNSVQSIEWNDFTEFLHKQTGPCKDDLLRKLRLLPTTQLEKKHYSELLKDFKPLFQKIEETIEQNYFGGLYNQDGMAIPEEFWPDRFFIKLNGSRDADDFVENFRTYRNGFKERISGNLERDLKAIFEIYRTNIFGTKLEVVYDKIPFGDCSLERALQIETFSVSAVRVVWTVRLVAYINCDCNALSTPQNLDWANVHLEVPMVMRLTNMDLNSSQFVPPSGREARPRLKIKSLSCCEAPNAKDKDPEEDDGVKEDDGDKDEGGKNAGDGEGHGYMMDLDATKQNCCAESDTNFSVGFFPQINLGDNFKDSTLGLGVEVLKNLGTSFGNNEWYAGAQGAIAVSAAQGGEIKENFFAGTAIVENRTPVLPCTQFVQRLWGQYGSGTLEAFGNKDNFTQFTAGLNVGINLEITPKVSVGGDVILVEIGQQTFKPDNGPDIKTDIGNFNLGRQSVRFGVRLKL